VQVTAIRKTAQTPWLIEGLWAEEGVGIVGGAPKCLKTWLALEMALSVAAGKPVLDTYAVPRSGPVLVFAAEDAPEMIRTRLEGLAIRSGVNLARVPLHLILASRLRLDTDGDQARLGDVVARYRPRLLVLDPFVRVHNIDENSAMEVSRVLAYLRTLQREHHVAVVVVHHARKAGAGGNQAGLSLRGSGDFYAWGDSYLVLRRQKDRLVMIVEHRSAAPPDPVELMLRTDNGTPPYLEVTSHTKTKDLASLKERILARLDETDAPMTQEALRAALKVRMQNLVCALREMQDDQTLVRTSAGWTAPAKPHTG
jgi:hypothetical protein